MGERIRGSWWGHPQGREIYRAAQAICESPSVLVCKLVEGKISYVHRRLWPALVRLAARFRKDQLARVSEDHTPSGAHESHREPFPRWVPAEVRKEAETLSVREAEEIWSPWLALAPRPARRGRGRRRVGSAEVCR